MKKEKRPFPQTWREYLLGISGYFLSQGRSEEEVIRISESFMCGCMSEPGDDFHSWMGERAKTFACSDNFTGELVTPSVLKKHHPVGPDIIGVGQPDGEESPGMKWACRMLRFKKDGSWKEIPGTRTYGDDLGKTVSLSVQMHNERK